MVRNDMNKKQICKVAVFLALLTAAVTYLSSVLVAKWELPCFESVVQEEFYNQEKDSIEVCILGSSQIVFGISGMKLYEDHGISAYNLGSAIQPMVASYAWLKECVKTQDIRLVVLDVSVLYEDSDQGYYRKAFDNMKLSPNKIEALREYTSYSETADPLSSFIFRIAKYHSRWSELKENDYRIQDMSYPVFKGFYGVSETQPVNFNSVAYDNDKEDPDLEMYDYQREYFERIVEYCEENNIELLLVKTPKNNWGITKHEQVEAYAQEHGLPFLDFSSMAMLEAVGMDAEKDFRDAEHLNMFGAEKLTAWLGDYLAENYDLTDIREKGEEPEDYERYVQRREDVKLQACTDVTKYFTMLNDDRYEVLVQLMDDSKDLCTEELSELMKDAGMSVDLENIDDERYMAWLRGGECLYEEKVPNTWEFADKFSDGIGFRMICSFAKEDTSRIRVNYENVSFGGRGLNVLVYDHENHSIADLCTIYYDETEKDLRILKNNKY